MVAMIIWHTLFFWLFALAACGFAVAVVLARHIVRMAFYLILSLGAVAGLFFLAGADLVGAMQLMIYVGGTLVLLVFGVMLTAQGPWVTMKTGPLQLVASALVGSSLLVLLVWAAWSVPDWKGRAINPGVEAPPTATRLGMALTGVRVDQLPQKDPLVRRGMSGYLLPFEIVSVHLLVVLVGAAFLARAKRRAGKPTPKESAGP
jgi:NADH-quinone oxidoreductase subunit J